MDDDLRRLSQVASTAVITESLPQSQHVVFIGGGKVAHGGEAIQKPFVVRHDGHDRRLLEHDLADPDPIRIGRAPPRQIACVPFIPMDELPTEGGVL